VKKKKILITGANGFLGKECLRFFLNKKQKITAWARTPDSRKVLKKQFPSAKILCGDICRIKSEDKYDLVIHQAGLCETKIRRFPSQSYVSVHEKGMSTLLKRIRFDFLIFNSTIKGYPSGKGKRWEKSQLKKRKSPYAKSLYRMEDIAKKNIPGKAIVLRCCNIYGPTQKKNSVVPVFLDRALKSKPLFLMDAQQRMMQPIYIEDYLSALEKIIQAPKPGIYNLAGKERISLLELAQTIAKEAKSKASIEFSSKNSPKNPEIIDGKFRKTFGWKPQTGVREGIKKIIKKWKNKK
jgi:nucleoside-diphosphate-sugar epimerase